jgi:hypothetical protein
VVFHLVFDIAADAGDLGMTRKITGLVFVFINKVGQPGNIII